MQSNFESEKVKTLVDPEKPLVSQLKKIWRQLLQKNSNGMDLSLKLPALLDVPELLPVTQTFVQFHQIDPQSLDESLLEFADLLIRELVNAGITSLKLLEDMVIKIHQKNPKATLDDWIASVREFDERFMSMISADDERNSFDLDVALQVIIMHNIGAIQEVEKFLAEEEIKPWMIRPTYCDNN